MDGSSAAEGLHRGSTAEELAAVLRTMILTGRLEPDEPMREAALSERFAVSRRTVRDALSVLEHEGLVRHHRHKGSRVTRLGPEDITDLYEVRRALEGAAALACANAPQERREALTEALVRLHDATTLGHAEEVVLRDLEFHQAVVGLLASPRIDQFFATIAVEMRYALAILEASYQESRRRPKAAFTEHKMIHDVLLEGKPRPATALVARHIDINRALLVRAVSGDLSAPTRGHASRGARPTA